MEFDNNNNNNNISNDLFETQRFKHNRNKIKKRVQEGFISNFFNASIIEGIAGNTNSDSELTKKRKTTLIQAFVNGDANSKDIDQEKIFPKYKVGEIPIPNLPPQTFITVMTNTTYGIINQMSETDINKFFDGNGLKYKINQDSIQSIINIGYNNTSPEINGEFIEKLDDLFGEGEGKINVGTMIGVLDPDFLKIPPTTSKKTYQQTSKIDVSSFKCETNEEKNKFPCNWEDELKKKIKTLAEDKVHGPQKLIDDYNNNILAGSDNTPNKTRLVNLYTTASNNYLTELRKLITEKNTQINEERLKLIKKITNTEHGEEKGISQIQDKYDNLKDRIKIMDFDDGKMREDPYKLYNKQLYLKRNKDEALLMLSSEKAKFAFWGILAFVLGIATIINFKKKID